MAIHYYILDLETTGTSVGYHEIIQISIIRCSDRVQLSRDVKAEYPQRANPVALEVTQKTLDDIVKGETKENIVKTCNDFFNQDQQTPEARCIIGHNIINFDKKFLHNLWAECNQSFPANLWLDTIPYFKEYMKKHGIVSRKTNLEFALSTVGAKSRGVAHNAIVDTQNNYILWHKLKQEIPSLNFIKRASHILE